MKYKFLNIFILSLVVTAFSCNKRLDINPAQSLDEKAALNTSGDVQVALVGSYTLLGNIDFYGGSSFVMSELLADYNEVSWSGTYQGLTQIYNKSIPVNNGFVSRTWLSGYATINATNNVLSALDVVATADKNRIEGEAKFIRAAAYFQLVKLFAKDWNNGDPNSNDGVPLVLTPTRGISDENKVPRAKVAAVYTQLISDLVDAEAKLPASNGFFATKNAAAALLARVYLQKRDYANARDAANRAISSNRYSLLGYYPDAFPYKEGSGGNTSEDIFSLQVRTNSGVNDFQTYYSAYGRGDITISPAHLSLYQGTDQRQDLFYTSGGSVYNGKNDYIYSNVHIIRLAEMYLIRAEANYRLGTTIGATPLADLNKIRNRVGLSSTLVITNVNEILLERKLELAFEGFNLSDIKRLGVTTGYFTGGGGLAATSPKLILPIPERETRVNPNLTQNEGY